MKKVIKEYWNTLKNEYENQFRETLFKDYEKTSLFLKKFRKFLKELYLIHPENVDVVCMFASVELSLRNEDNVIKVLEDFVSKYKDEKSDIDKARIYTNLGFYYEGYDKCYQYLIEAEKLKSPFEETYKGLALYHFSNYRNDKVTEAIYKSLEYYKKALRISDNYEFWLGHAVCLFEAKEYQKSKEIFEKLLLKYPNRMRLLLGIAYCEVYSGCKNEAINILKQIQIGQDKNYSLNTDDIPDYEVFEAYYRLEEYDLFLEEFEKVIEEYYFSDWEYYLYTLWIKNYHEKFDRYIDKYKAEIYDSIENIKVDEDLSNQEKEDYIKGYKEDLEKFMTTAYKIQSKNYKPIIKLELYPEYSCFLIDCVKHKL